MKRKAIIVTAFINYDFDIRIKFLRKCLLDRGYEVTILSSDFDHRNKQTLICGDEGIKLLNVPSYKKNISIKRVYSHRIFAKKMFEECKIINPDLIYAITPPNFIFRFLNKYKTEYANVKIILEIEDLWPESLPIGKKMKGMMGIPMNVWTQIRDKNIQCANIIIFECDLFKNYMEGRWNIRPICKTLYLSKEDTFIEKKEINEEEWRFLYLGSINNLIDIDLIVRLLKIANQHKKTVFEIVGDGEKKKNLVEKCRLNGIEVVDNGIVYDNRMKQGIIGKCQFAFNIMKETVFVGATMKSLEYFHYGIPLINNIPADTKKIIDKYACGFNITDLSSVDGEFKLYLEKQTSDTIKQMSNNSRKVYCDIFSPTIFEKKMETVLDIIEGDCDAIL